MLASSPTLTVIQSLFGGDKAFKEIKANNLTYPKQLSYFIEGQPKLCSTSPLKKQKKDYSYKDLSALVTGNQNKQMGWIAYISESPSFHHIYPVQIFFLLADVLFFRSNLHLFISSLFWKLMKTNTMLNIQKSVTFNKEADETETFCSFPGSNLYFE